MPRTVLDPYRRAQEGFEMVLHAVPAGGWDAPSECELWTVRDVAGHVIWGQEQQALGDRAESMAGRTAPPERRTPLAWRAPIPCRHGARPEPRPTTH